MNPGLSYRETAVAGASPIRLVILLYEQVIEDLRRAVSAHRQGDIAGRTRELNHALLVLGHLQATLDKNQGGPVAANLERFYQQLRTSLLEAQVKQSVSLLERQISHLLLVYEAWCEIERELRPGAGHAQPPNQPSSEWNA